MAVEKCLLPILGVAEEFERRHEALPTALDGNPATLKERSLSVFTLGFAVKQFKEKNEVGRNLQVRLTKDNEVTNVQDRVRPDILKS